MAARRKYELKRRAEAQAETRRRITAAAVELHGTVGPAATRITEVARRAGVQRATVYNHFPDDASLFAACSAHWRELHPAPSVEAWTAIADPQRRLRHGLRELYEWYRETEPMTANVQRDAQVLPELRAVLERGFGGYIGHVLRTLAATVPARGRRRARVEAAVRVATEFGTWRALAPLGDEEAAELAAGLVELAARPG